MALSRLDIPGLKSFFKVLKSETIKEPFHV